jgi:hypothetical protein
MLVIGPITDCAIAKTSGVMFLESWHKRKTPSPVRFNLFSGHAPAVPTRSLRAIGSPRMGLGSVPSPRQTNTLVATRSGWSYTRSAMNLLESLLEKPLARLLQSPPIEAVLTRLGLYSRLGVVLAVIWFVVNRPFSRHWLVPLCAMAFAALMLPAEMMFFLRHPLLAFAVPFAAGFVAANFGTSGIGTVAASVVVAVATYRASTATRDRPLAAITR